VQSRLRDARIARLATIDASDRPHLVPICFVYEKAIFYTAVDRKPKRVAPEKLTRIRNIQARPQIALLVDEYRERWDRLWYIQVRGKAKLLSKSARAERARALRLLRLKYPQYSKRMLPDDAPILRITPEQIVTWGQT
jgi:PPOX class probable F420-dependent enzyme